MQREVLFRGKPIKPSSFVIKENGEKYVDFIYGGFYRDFEYGGCKEGKDYIILYNSTGMGFTDQVLVEKESVGQYIGINDCKGKRIFENDIVKYINFIGKEDIGIIEYANASFSIYNGCTRLYAFIDYEIEVIGNKTDNPELVEKIINC